MQYIKRFHAWLSESAHHRRGTRIVQIGVAFLMLFRVFTESPFALYLWGPRGLGGGSSTFVFGATVGGWMDGLFATEVGVFAVLATMAAAAVMLMAGRFTRVASFVALVTFWALEMRFPELADGGDNVTRLLLAYSMLVLPPNREARPGSLSVWLHNVGVLAIGAQLITIYLTSGFLKAFGESWQNGTALYKVSQVEWFSLPATRGLLANPLFTTAACYGTVAFQVWFPIAIFTRFRLVWLAVGISLHLGIAVMMGLVTFSAVMCSLELFLVTDAEWAFFAERAHSLRERIARHPRVADTWFGHRLSPAEEPTSAGDHALDSAAPVAAISPVKE